MDLTLVAASTGTPVSLAEARDHLRITGNEHDAEISRKLKAAVEYCERRVPGHRKFMAATYDGKMREFPDWRITLPMPPLSGVTSIAYVTSTGGTTTLSSTGYTVQTPTEAPGYIEPAYGESWPTARWQPNGVTIRFVAGSTSTATVPECVKQAIKIKLDDLFDALTEAERRQVNDTVDSLLMTSAYGSYG